MKDTHFDDAARLRIAQADADTAASQAPGVATRGAPCVVGQTKTISAYPAGATSFFAVAPVDVTGPEVEGGPGTLGALSSTFYALNLGSAVPPVGANVICTFVDSRWVFRYDG